MSIEHNLIARSHQVVERMIAQQGDKVEPELLQLQHDIVEWDRAGSGEHFTVEAEWDAAHGR